MKKIFVFLLAFISLSASAQIYQAQNGYGFQYKRLKIDSTLHIPTFCGVPTLRNSVIGNQSAIAFDSCNNILYKYDPKSETWSPIGTGSYIQDGLISGGIVTWSGSGLKFYVTPAIYVIGGKFYNSPFDSVTLATAPTSDSRIDLIGVDTTGHAFATTGTASATPIVPQADIGSQIALTTGILLNANDTIPPQVATTVIYDENLGSPYEYVTHTQGQPITIDFGNTDNPKQGSKDILISKYVWGSEFYFTGQQYSLTNDAVLTGWVKLNGKFNATLYALCYNSSTKAITNWIPVIFNPFDSTGYQSFSVPLSSFTWAGNNNSQFDVVEFHFSGTPDTSGSKGLYLDNISLQKGINSIPPQTDYSNKLDSVLLSGDSLFQYVKGVKTFKGLASGSGTGGNTKYVLQGYGTIIDSPDVNHYIVNIDTTIKSPINVVLPIKAIDSTTIGFDALNLPELRYSQASRDTTSWPDSTLIDKKYLNDRIAAFVTSAAPWKTIGTATYYKKGNVLIGDSTDDGHTLRVVGTISFNLGGDQTGDIFVRDALGSFVPVHPPTGLTKPVLGFSTIPVWQEDSTGGGTGSSGDSILSFTKNATKDSIILTTNRARLAVKDSIGGGSILVYYDTAVAPIGNVNWNVTMPGVTSYYKGLTVAVYFNTASTGVASTLNINGLGAVLLKYNSTNVITNEIANQTVVVMYDGTYWQIINYDYHVLPKVTVVNFWTSQQSMSGGIVSLGKLETYSQSFRGNIWMGSGTTATSTTWSYYEENTNPVFMRVGMTGPDNSVTTSVTSGYDYANLLLGKNYTSAASGPHALWSNLAVLTPTVVGTTTGIVDAQNIYVGDAPTVGTNNYSINAGYSHFRAPIQLKGYTVATLPTGHTGDAAYVTDATSPTYLGTLTGGGSVTCPVFYNGSAWVSH